MRPPLLPDPWFRLYTHTLLLESRIFPDVELCDESPDYVPVGLADIWKGNLHGNPVCIKAIRTSNLIRLEETKMVRDSFCFIGGGLRALHTSLSITESTRESTFPIRTYSPSSKSPRHWFRFVS